MITIPAHGVKQEYALDSPESLLSPMQALLLNDPAPIRICGAPTGAGKTYAFLEFVRRTRAWVLFVVPTQALAANIGQAADEHQVTSVVWDGRQSSALREHGCNVWTTRYNELQRVDQSGGMIITTPETLGQIFLGKPNMSEVPQLDVEALLLAKHIVFDEAHTLTERAFGFVHAWMGLIAGRAATGRDVPKLSLLSATHSGLLAELIGSDPSAYIPEEYVHQFDESILSEAELVPFQQSRLLHGDVTLNLAVEPLPELVGEYMPTLLKQHQRLLIVFDSLRKFSEHSCNISQWAAESGLSSHEVYVVNGQDRQVSQSLDAARFDAGLEPEERHRVIIGTSAIELGITYPGVTAALMDSGLTPASLIQRIGRVARGPHPGQVWIARPEGAIPSHYLTLKDLDGARIPATEFRDHFNPLIAVNFKRARALDQAYWSMLRNTRTPAFMALATLHSELSEKRLPGGHLNQLRAQSNDLRPRAKIRYQKWLKAIDRTLTDVRGFSPSVSVQFADFPPIEYSRDWILRYLRDPDQVDVERNLWIYSTPRNTCLLDRPRTVTIRLYLPTGETRPFAVPPGPNAFAKVLEEYCDKIVQTVPLAEPIWLSTREFVWSTGLLTRADEDVLDIDGSLLL